MDDLFRRGGKSGAGKVSAKSSSSLQNTTSSCSLGAEGETEKKLDQLIEVFRYLQDKDVFESYYKQSFAKRLINGCDEDSEKVESCYILRN